MTGFCPLLLVRKIMIYEGYNWHLIYKVTSARIYTIANGDGTMGRNLDIAVTRDGYSDTKVADFRISGKYRD